jgi:hypothetical protein
MAVFAEQQELPLFPFQANAEQPLIVTGHALDELGERVQFGRGNRDVGFGIVRIGDGHAP